MQTQSTELARERVCHALLDRITVMDKMLEEAELEDNQPQLKRIYRLQSNALNRLEKLVNTSDSLSVSSIS